MQRTTTIFALFAALTIGLSDFLCAAENSPVKALLITGDDVGAHNWREIASATREVLESSGRIHVRAVEDPLILESETALKAYDVIVFLMYNRSVPEVTDQAKENLLEFVKEGKGFYSQHLATASFAKWDEFGKLCGRKWVMGTSGHGPRSVFQADIACDTHPITKGLKAFGVDDELYAKLQGDGPIDVLVTADSDWSGRNEPLVMTSQYGKGRSVHNAFGHDRKAIMTPEVQKLIVRGVEWAATGTVAE
jgi:type 1 glutamine amidotransferase